MKLLLTGEPGSGKTTLLEDFIAAVPDKQGFVTREVRKDGARVGFELVSSFGATATLASVGSDSNVRVSRYGVELGQLDAFLEELPPVQPGTLLYVDEIGQMELFSDRFKDLVTHYLDTDNFYAGTITSVFTDEFTEQVISRDDVLLFRIDAGNRDQTREVLRGLAGNIKLLGQLSPAVQTAIVNKARGYAQRSQFTQLVKLFKNAVKYLAEGRVQQIDADTYHISGNTNEHTITRQSEGGDWQCDCDLFRGEGMYVGQAGECSHMQAVTLSRITP